MPILYKIIDGKAVGKYVCRTYSTKSVEVEKGTDKEIRSAIAKKLSEIGELNAGAYMGIMSAIKSPKTSEGMKLIGKLGLKARYGKKKV